ncbi:seed lectin-like [Benincasa hispida]|uniref:seed lectin-like n=1 Tax=Benincasa hispida TaxID=102211 RepID=UPI0018FF1F3D|nr:seed lectin-like [Benincasa hispida]
MRWFGSELKQKKKDMRVLVALIIALCIAIDGITAAKTPISDRYKTYIQNVRQKFASQTHKQLYGIPMLQHSLSNSDRFLLIDTANVAGDTITLAVDAQDMSVVAYLAGDNDSYFFSNAPLFTFDILFPNTHQTLLSYDNTFESIENAANTTRQAIPLGLNPSNSAISNLFHYRPDLAAVSFLVVFQMIFEAAKFKFIEQTIVNCIKNGESFTPNLAIVSLEDNWSQLSLQIQSSTSLQGLFGSSVMLHNSKNEAIEVDSIYFPIILNNLALQLYHCNTQDYIKLPSLVENSRCYVEEHTTRISGRDGLCADVADGSHVISFPCRQQANQQWTFYSDRTIRSLGKCLIPSKSSSNPLAVIYDCSKVSQQDATWEVSLSGTIMNTYNDSVLTSNNGSTLTMEDNAYDGNQGWRVGNFVDPIVTSIIGVKEMCLEATEGNTNIWLEECVKDKIEQSWTLYSDGSIRVNNNHSLCVTASIHSRQRIVILNCNGLATQRWVFKADGTISTPKDDGLVMDVAQNDVDLKRIVLYPRHGGVNQQWVVFY